MGKAVVLCWEGRGFTFFRGRGKEEGGQWKYRMWRGEERRRRREREKFIDNQIDD
jgi:hypothetical protein